MLETEEVPRYLTHERGWLATVTPANPAAGANFSFTVGSLGGIAARVVSAKATLTTDSNAANRLFSLDYQIGRYSSLIRNAPTNVITASTAATVFQWDHAHNLSEWNTNTPVFVPLVDVWLEPGWTVQLTVDNIQVGDTITNIAVVLQVLYAD